MCWAYLEFNVARAWPCWARTGPSHHLDKTSVAKYGGCYADFNLNRSSVVEDPSH